MANPKILQIRAMHYWGISMIYMLLFCSIAGISQSPDIYYGNYKLLTKDSVMDPLLPNNKGGLVPANAYTATSTLLNMNTFWGKQNRPSSIAMSANGNMYVADETNNTLKLIMPNGQVQLIADKKKMDGPAGIALDSKGNVYVSDCFHHQIKKISPSNKISILAGTGKPGNANNKNGLLASFSFPTGIGVDASGNVYVADEGNNLIRKITPEGSVTTLAGNGTVGAADNKNGLLASFNQPNGLAVDSLGNVFVADQLNHKIRKVSATGEVVTIAGTGLAGSSNTSTSASFNNPRGIAVDAIGNIYVGDVGNHQIRKISPIGEVSTLAGSGAAGILDNQNGLQAEFHFPNGLALDNKGNILVADYFNNSIRKISGVGYSIMPIILPQGIQFNYTTGIFSGRPTQSMDGQQYTISAYNQEGSSSTTLGFSVAAQPGNALHFDGFDDLVIVPNAPSLNPETVTVEMWINANKNNIGCRYLLKRNSLRRFDDSYAIGMDSSYHFRAVMVSGNEKASGQRFAKQLEPAEMGKWYHLTGVFRQDSLILYVNGVFQESVHTGFPISHGINALSFGFDRSADFMVDEVRVFSTDRSAYITTDMLNSIPSNTAGLIAYYNFNIGRSNGSNNAYTNLYDLSVNENHGKLQNFLSLQGKRSNWVESYAMVVPVTKAASNIYSTGFTANWLVPYLGIAENYLLDVSEDASFKKFVEGYKSMEVMETSKMIEGLKPNTNYYYRVRANKRTVDGQGCYSPTIHVRTSGTTNQ
jgi:sugar lactone lactonase YvrE